MKGGIYRLSDKEIYAQQITDSMFNAMDYEYLTSEDKINDLMFNAMNHENLTSEDKINEWLKFYTVEGKSKKNSLLKLLAKMGRNAINKKQTVEERYYWYTEAKNLMALCLSTSNSESLRSCFIEFEEILQEIVDDIENDLTLKRKRRRLKRKNIIENQNESNITSHS